jgi:hypothetical protein
MTANWIPRAFRWNETQRKEKETIARQNREKAKKLWIEKEEIRKQIEKEIETKKLAMRALLD